MRRYWIALITILCCMSGSSADDWARFRGPNGTGTSATSGLPVEFGPEQNLLWKTPLPAGHSSPALGRDRIFLTGYEGSKLFTICLDRTTGRLLWQREVPRNRTDRLQNPNNPASPSPVTDGENVYAFFQDFGLVAYSSNGKELWRLPLGPFNSYYGMGASPVLVDDKVVMSCDQDTNSFLIAVDKKSGQVRWRRDRPWAQSGYSTPILFQPPNVPAQIVLPESFQLTAYSVENGERVWWVRGLAWEMKATPASDNEMLYINGWGLEINQPGKQVAVASFESLLTNYDADKDGRISKTERAAKRPNSQDDFVIYDLDRDGYLISKEWEIFRSRMSAENGLLAVKLGGKGDMTATNILWRYQKPVPQVPSTLLYKGVLYMVNDGGVLTSFDPATGTVIKQGRLQDAAGKYFASPVAGDDKIYLVSDGGAVSVLKADGDWQILKVNQLEDECFATPAIAAGKIYIRTRRALYCFANKS
jgi:outer membrane protein assembly factor BamB